VRGDPSAALLEVLDPEQNHTFRDHYLAVPFDLSRVVFIATANLAESISPPLRDRMETLRLSGYSEEEKLAISERFLVPRQIAEAGLSARDLSLGRPVLRKIIAEYTREAGLRELERLVAQLARKVARRVVQEDRPRDDKSARGAASGSAAGAQGSGHGASGNAGASGVGSGSAATGGSGHSATGGRSSGRRAPTLSTDDVVKYLGPPRYLPEERSGINEVGTVQGLAWTPYGGEVLHVEATTMAGKGSLILTGQLGDVMKESAQAALSFARAHALELGLGSEFYASREIHIHVPSGAVPKDGPSAGVTMACALVSLVSGIPVRHDVAMTGEITLRGRVLPIGGLKEKLLAASRAGIRTVIVPAANMPELSEIPEHVREKLTIVPAKTMRDVLAVALARPPRRVATSGRARTAPPARA
jgi:ATP-dependent Lon protease